MAIELGDRAEYIKQLEEQREEIRWQNKSLRKEHNKLREENNLLRKSLENVSHIETLNGKLRKENDTLKQTSKAQGEICSSLREEIQSLSYENDQLAQQLGKRDAIVLKLQQQKENTFKESERQKGNLLREIDKLREIDNKLQEEKTDLLKHNDCLQSDNDYLNEANEEWRELVDAYRDGNKYLRQENECLKSDNDHLKEILDGNGVADE